MPQPNQIARLDLRAELPDGEAAARLRARIENLGWRLLPRAIERTIDAFGPIDGHLRIDRLALDLGTVSAANLETETLAALERALAAALRDALGNARHAPTASVRLQDGAAWRLEQYEAYLATGTVANAPRGEPFAPNDAFALLAQTQPDELVAMLRRRGLAPYVLERLVAQLDAEGLAGLLALLAPADARAILDLLAQTLLAHRTALLERFVRLKLHELERALWIATLEFLLRDPGSQFNRRRYLEYLLRREAARTGVSYEALLVLLARALDVVRTAFGATASLPLTLGELLAERGLAQDVGAAASVRARASAAAAQGGDDVFDRLRTLAAAADPQRFERAASGLSHAEFDRLVAQIAPSHASAIRRTFADAEKLLAAVMPNGDVRALVLRSLLAQAENGRFDPAAWRGTLLRQIVQLLGASRISTWHRTAGRASGIGRRLRRRQAQLAVLRDRWAHVAAAVTTEVARLVDGYKRQRHAGPSVADFERLLQAEIDAAFAAAQEPPRDGAAIVDAALARLRSADAPDVRAAADAVAAAAPFSAQAFAFGREAAGVGSADADAASGSLIAEMAASFADAISAQIDPAAAADGQVERLFRQAARRAAASFGQAAQPLAARLAAMLSAMESARALAAALGQLWGRRALAQTDLQGAGAADPGPSIGTILTLVAARIDARQGTAMSVSAVVAFVERMLARAAAARTRETAPHRRARRMRHAALRDPRGLALLASEAADLAPVPRLALLAALAPGHVTEVAATADALLNALRRRKADMPPAPALARLVWARIFSYLAAHRGARLATAALQADVLADLAQTLGDDLQDVADILNAPAARLPKPQPQQPQATDAIAVLLSEVGRYLRYGRPHAAAYRLAAAVEHAPAGFAALVREIAEASPSLVPAMLERLLDALAPDELLACLDPANAESGVLPRDRGPALDAFFADLLAGRAPPPLPPPPKLGDYIDGLVALRESLDAEGGAAHPIRATLPALSLGELAWLFLAPDDARSLARLRRAIAALAPAQAEAFLDRLAPWTNDSAGPLAQARGLRAAPHAETAETRLRAALAGLADDKFNLVSVVGNETEESRSGDVYSTVEPASSVPVTRADLFAWLGGEAVEPAKAAAYAAAFADLADRDDPDLAAFVAGARGRPRVQAHWAAALPLRARARLLGLLAKPKARMLLDAALLAAAAWRQAAPFGAPRPSEQAIWEVLFAALGAPRDVEPGEILALLVDSFAGKNASLATQLRRRLANLTRDGGHASLAAALRRPPRRASAPEPRADPATSKGAAPRSKAAPPPAGVAYVQNAGLVLLGPYLPQLFKRLDVLAAPEGEAPRLRDLDAATRAVHLLQYLVDRRLDAPEPQLVLNKLLCGLLPAETVGRRYEATEEDIEICEDLLRAVVAVWTVLRNTGASGLRETFLQRAGRLTFGTARHDLKVERKGYDVLIARIPWSISLVKHRWMPAPLYVDW